MKLEKNKSSVNRLVLYLACTLASFLISLFLVSVYQLLRVSYCIGLWGVLQKEDYFKNLSTLWCSLFSYDFRPDLIVVLMLSFIIFVPYFVCKNKLSTLGTLSKTLTFLICMALFGIGMQWFVLSHYPEDLWLSETRTPQSL